MAFTEGVRGPGWSNINIRSVATLDTALPSSMSVTRGAGVWSEQTAAAANGTTFITRGTAENTGRFWYSPTAGRRMLIIEPARTNIVPYANWVDGAEGEANRPDNWGNIAGTSGVDYTPTAAVGPHGGYIFSMLDTATANRGVVQSGCTILDATQYTWSIWTRRTGTAGAASMFTFNAGANFDITLDATLHDWMMEQATATSTGAGTNCYMCQNGDVPGVLHVALIQLEAGAYATSNIFNAAGAAGTSSRAAELCTVTGLNAASGYVSFLFEPWYANNTFSTIHTLLEWAPNWRLDYNGGTDTFDVVVNGTIRSTSAAQTFAKRSLHRLAVRYGAAGTELTVNGVTTTNSTAWGTPVLASYLGSRAASANCESAMYGDLLVAA